MNEQNGQINRNIPQMHPRHNKSGVNYWVVTLLLLLILGGVAGSFFYKNKYKVEPMGAGYQAIFLDNNQVYFGKIESVKNGYIHLIDVYYLAPSTEMATSASDTLSLIKLGSELHGPTDEIFFREEHVLFYENLDPNGKMMQSISSQK